jgi:uncharacterized protein (DUF427 family)
MPESVWDYPRPPRIEPSPRTVRIEFGGETVANSANALRVLETASPPTIYVPIRDVRMDLTRPRSGHTFCEWKGQASYLDIVVGDQVAESAAFFYPEPKEPFAQLGDHLSFYAGRVDAAYLDDEEVRPQPGRFYAGWITDDIVGPFKGEPGTQSW